MGSRTDPQPPRRGLKLVGVDLPITRRLLLGQLAASGIVLAQSPGLVLAPDPLANLTKTHPRLILTDADLLRVNGLSRDHPVAHKLRDGLEHEAERLQTTPVSEFKLAGNSLSAVSRRILDRVYTLALLYRLEGQRSHFDRALKELRAAALFPNWNPQRFLDTAEMTYAFAIAYDWFYPALSVADRDWMRAAIIEKGMDPAIAAYKEPAGWVTAPHSWNLVCNAGAGIGALALADEEPDRARTILRNAFDSLPRALATYAPDGGWPEGPGYWNYATRYLVSLIASLETALDDDHRLSEARGLQQTGRFRVYFTGPANRTFNFADATDEPQPAPEMFWMARRFSQPVYAGSEERLDDRASKAEALDLVWFYKDGRPPQGDDWPLDTLFTGANVAFMRSSWDDPAAIFLGVKGGDNKANHSHLDLGTFVLDAGGVRWAYDPGADDYTLPGYLGKQRYTYFKTRTEAHSTILIDGENQDPKAAARITHHEFGPLLSFVQIDLAHAYPAKMKQLQRRIGIVQRQAIMIQDTLASDQPVDPLWGMMTEAEISVSGQLAELKKNDWTLSCEIRSPHHAIFDVVTAQNTTKLVVRIGAKVTGLDLDILLTPHKTGTPKPKITVDFPPASVDNPQNR